MFVYVLDPYLYVCTCTIRPCYNTVIVLTNSHIRHSITHPWVWGMRCLFLVQHLISVGKCKKDITPLLTHWSYIFLAQPIDMYPTLVSVTWYEISCYKRLCYIEVPLLHNCMEWMFRNGRKKKFSINMFEVCIRPDLIPWPIANVAVVTSQHIGQ